MKPRHAVILGTGLLLTTASTPMASAVDRVVPPIESARCLAAAAAAPAADIASVRNVLSTPQAARAMRVMGANANEVRAGVATLSTSELQDLAARVRAVDIDPAAGVSSEVNNLLVVFLVVAIVVLVLSAV